MSVANELKSKFERATNAHKYVHVKEKDGKYSTSGMIVLSGADDRWRKGENYVYVPDPNLRIAGEFNTVVNFLTTLGVNRSDAVNYLNNNAFTLDNHQARSAQIQQLVDAQKAYDKSVAAKPKAESFSLDQIRDILSRMDTAQPVKGEAKATGAKGGRGGAVKTLYDRVKELMAENQGVSPDSGNFKAVNITKINDNGRVLSKVKDKTGQESYKEQMAPASKYNPKGYMLLVTVNGRTLPIMVNRRDTNAAAQFRKAIRILNEQSPAGENFDEYLRAFERENGGQSIQQLVSGTGNTSAVLPSARPGTPPGFNTGLPSLPGRM